MKNLRPLRVTLSFALILAAVMGVALFGVHTEAQPAQNIVLPGARTVAPNQLVVGFRPSAKAATRSSSHQKAVGHAGDAVATVETLRTGDELVTVSGPASLDAVIASYRGDPAVASVEPNGIVSTAEVPSDPLFASTQANMNTINAGGAWDLTHGSPLVKLAIIDCGIHDVHPDLSPRVVASVNFSPSSASTDDRCNHGTHVAGIAAATIDNGVGVAGVAGNVSILNDKVLDDGGTGSDASVANGIMWAGDNASVINMSLGTTGPCPSVIQTAVDYAWSKGVMIVAAAGNNGLDQAFYPADCNHVMAVGATYNDSAHVTFSNYGPWVAVAAPGFAIESTVNPALNSGKLYANNFSGTSMAAPHVAGIAALIMSYPYQSNVSATTAIEQSASPVAGTDIYWTYGVVNAGAALRYALHSPSLPSTRAPGTSIPIVPPGSPPTQPVGPVLTTVPNPLPNPRP